MTIPSRVNYQKLCDHLIRRIRIRDETVQDSVVITGFTYCLPEWQNGVLFHYAMPIVDDDSLNVLWNFMAQNPYCLGAEIHAELSENRGGEEDDDDDDDTWSMPSDHDYDDGDDGDEEDDDDEEEEDDDDGEGGEQPNFPPYFYLQGNEEDEELSYADSYGVIPGSTVGGFDGEFYKGQIFHSKQAAQVAMKHYALQRNFQYNVVESSPSIWKIRCLMHKEDKCPWMVRFGCREMGGDWSVRKVELVHT
ncbi:unnamed protein product [Linum trigynum]|uniref:Transposase MuDR plant domain-containing protein n=1 Tax=Linum trigynum TaxID=586398 RepID=A0AAV2F5D5_9ROSI